MKVSEYKPFYKQFSAKIFAKELITYPLNRGWMTINELFDNHPEEELNELEVDFLNLHDLHCLIRTLNEDYFTESTVTPFLREMFDDYRMSGYNPLDWLYYTFDMIHANITDYKPELRAVIEKNLLDWIETYEKLNYKNPSKEFENEQEESYKDNLWFKVGVLFASGKMEELKKQFDNNSTRIAKHLGDKNYRPYISDSIGKSAKRDKNIFANQNKLLKIKCHCEENGIPLVEEFLKHILSK